MEDLLCPICGSELLFDQESDGVTRVIFKIGTDGKYYPEEKNVSSCGSRSVYCTKDRYHEIPADQQDAIFQIAEDFGY